MLSRSCNAEQALKMSLGKNWEGKASYEAEPEELPDLDARNILLLIFRQAKLGKLGRKN